VQEGDLNRRIKRSVSFVTGASAVIVALALMAIADNGGELPGIGRVPVITLPGLGPRTAAPAVPHEPVETPVASPRRIASQSATPTPIVEPEASAPSAPAELVRIDNPAPVTAPLVTPPVAKKPRPEPVPVTSPSAPPSETPPKRQFGGPGIAGAHGSGRGLSGGSGGTPGGHAQTNKHRPPGKAKGKDKGRPHGNRPHGNGSHRAADDGHARGAQHDDSCPPDRVSRAQTAADAPPERGRKAARS
jgi:hypothetical protein